MQPPNHLQPPTRVTLFFAGVIADDTEPIPKRIAAERSWPRPLLTKLHLDEAAFRSHFLKCAIEIVNVKVDVHRSPVPFVSAHVGAIGRRLRASRFLVHTDRQVVCIEDCHRRERPCDFDEPEYGFIKPQSRRDIWNVDAHMDAWSRASAGLGGLSARGLRERARVWSTLEVP